MSFSKIYFIISLVPFLLFGQNGQKKVYTHEEIGALAQKVSQGSKSSLDELMTVSLGKVRKNKWRDGKLEPGGKIIHEVGGALMGTDAKKSVCNKWNQTWDIPNLFLADGSPFASNADKNPTLTIMALAWRAGEYLLDQAKKGNL